jgi:beta-glucanase (GH16 family)
MREIQVVRRAVRGGWLVTPAAYLLSLIVLIALVAPREGALGPSAPVAAPTVEAVGNGSATSDLAGWQATSAAGPVTVRRVTGVSGAFVGTTAVELSRGAGTGSWARALVALRSPDTYFQVGRTYRMRLWVRDLTGSRRSVGVLLANGGYAHRPTEVSVYDQFADTGWHLISRTFIATSTGYADTALYIGLPGSGAFRFQVTNASVAPVTAAAPARITGAPTRTVTFAGPAGSAVDATVWNHQTGGHGWGNGEAQTYTARRVNSQVDGAGRLKITALRETLTGTDGITRSFTSARLTTQNKLNVAPGSYVEAAITAPTGPGVWPAFWTLGSNLDTVGWPASGELDILEAWGAQPTMAFAAAHMASRADAKVDKPYGWGEAGGTLNLGEPVDARSQLYGVYFDGQTVRFYVDRKERMALWAADAQVSGRQWAFGSPQFLLLNVAIAGGVDTSATTFPRVMTVGPISIWKGGIPF